MSKLLSWQQSDEKILKFEAWFKANCKVENGEYLYYGKVNCSTLWQKDKAHMCNNKKASEYLKVLYENGLQERVANRVYCWKQNDDLDYQEIDDDILQQMVDTDLKGIHFKVYLYWLAGYTLDYKVMSMLWGHENKGSFPLKIERAANELMEMGIIH